MTLGPGNGYHGRVPRTPARERVRTDRFRSDRPAPLDILDHLVDVGVRFGGSEPHRDPGHGPLAPSPPRWRCEPPRPGMLDGGSPRPLRQRPGEPDLLRQAVHPRSRCSGRLRPHRSTVPRVPRCLLRQAPNPRTERTDLLRQTPTLRTERTDLLRQQPTLRRVPEPLRRSWGFVPRPPVPASAGTARRREGTRRPLPDRSTAHLGGRPPDHPEAPPPASASGGFAPASADAEGTLEDSGGLGRRPRWLRSPRDLGEARRLRPPGVHSRPSSSEDERPARRRRKPPSRGEGRQRTCSRRPSKSRATGRVRPGGWTETAGRQRPQQCGTAADEGNSS